MKKRLLALLMGACLALSMAFSALAASDVERVGAQLRPDFTIVIDEKERTFFNVDGDEVHPILYDGTTYLPVRAIGELMDKNVNWDQSTLTITLDGKRTADDVTGKADKDAETAKITAQIRPDFTVVIDGKEKTFKDAQGDVVYPLLYNGSTYLPIRAIGEIMGKEVEWNAKTNTVTLSGDRDDSLVTDADSFHEADAQKPDENKMIALAKAKEIALKDAGLKASQVTFVKAMVEKDDGRWIYDVEFYTSDREYDYQIGAYSGKILSVDHSFSTTDKEDDARITVDKAKKVALKDAGLSQSDVTFVKAELERENGRWVYEVEFYTEKHKEYDYEIDAYTGKILSFDYDAEHFDRDDREEEKDDLISLAKAKEIVAAKISGVGPNEVPMHLDYDDGRPVYEGELRVNGAEYEYEIDARTGTILDWDVDDD